MNLIEAAKSKIKGRGLTLVMPEGEDERIRAAATVLARDQLAEPIVFTEQSVLTLADQHVSAVRKLRPKLTIPMAQRLLNRPLARAGIAVTTGEAHAMLAGVQNTTAKVIEAGMLTIGLADGIAVPSSFFLMQWPDRNLVFADCAVNIDPTAQELADIAIVTAASSRSILTDEPRVALLSFSTDGSAKHARVQKIAEACALAKAKSPDLKVDGEFQLDTALSETVARRKLSRSSAVAGNANVLIFPDLDSGNIAYKTAQYLGGAKPVGPVLQGFARPVSDLSRGASVDEIIATAVLLLAQVK